jgi:NDP-sugar pyrophosphorylase family protein
LLPADTIREPLFVMNGDLLTNLDFNKLLRFHEDHDGVATMCVREHEHRVPYGVIETDGQRITSMVEKPAYRYFINAGIYVLSPDVIGDVARGRSVDMPSLLQEQMGQGRTINMFPLHEYWLDIGRVEDFQRAQFEVGDIFHG